MELDFNDREQVTDYISVPEGTYLCRIMDVRERQTRNGDALWALKLMVAEGEFSGRDAAWDNLVFSSRGLNRVKTVFAAFGLPADGKIQVDPGDLLNREVFATVRPAEYMSAEGSIVRRNEVPYDGYQAVEKESSATVDPPDEAREDAGEAEDAEDALPF
jgi:Protein of unknown function (DUF669)